MLFLEETDQILCLCFMFTVQLISMNAIIKAGSKDAQLISEIAKQSFIESHGHSASVEDVNAFRDKTYSYDAIKEELDDLKNIYHVVWHDKRPAGYSKIIFNFPYKESDQQNITKLERIYLLKAFYDLKLGRELLQFNINLAKQNAQAGMWLYTWKENQRAIEFYKKHGFVIIGSYDFRISENHSNPNHQMFLQF